MNDNIEVTHVDLRLLVQTAYDLSKPQGLGFIHYQPGLLSEEDADELLKQETYDSNVVIGMDYVKGRQIKMTVFKEPNSPNRMFIHGTWYDHSEEEFCTFLRVIGADKQ